MRRILSILLENESGALSRIIGLFSQRGYNIETLNVAPTEDESLSRLTLTTSGDSFKVEQITKQLNKLIDVVKVIDVTDGDYLERDLLLVKISTQGIELDEVKCIADIFRGQIVDVGPEVYVIQLSGSVEKLDSFLAALSDMRVMEVVRSGVIGMVRGGSALSL